MFVSPWLISFVLRKVNGVISTEMRWEVGDKKPVLAQSVVTYIIAILLVIISSRLVGKYGNVFFLVFNRVIFCVNSCR